MKTKVSGSRGGNGTLGTSVDSFLTHKGNLNKKTKGRYTERTLGKLTLYPTIRKLEVYNLILPEIRYQLNYKFSGFI